LDLRALFFKQISLVGATMGSFAELRQAWRAVEAGAVRPVLDSVVPMSALAVGHARLERRDVLGKIVLVQDLTG
jgi:zinc-binding alcohol dehydrogenase/oxidoreductase